MLLPENQNLFESILRDFDENGILQDFILIGSWALKVYSEKFDQHPLIPTVTTLDIDFLLTNPPKVSHKVDIGSILEKYGLEEDFSLLSGLAKFVSSDIEVEFLIPDRGAGIRGGYTVDDLGIVAQPLRYLDFINDHAETMLFRGISVRVPEPVVFVLMKYLIIIKRTGQFAKKIPKDVETAKGLKEFLLEQGEQEAFRERYLAMPKGWQKTLRGILREYDQELLDILN